MKSHIGNLVYKIGVFMMYRLISNVSSLLNFGYIATVTREVKGQPFGLSFMIVQFQIEPTYIGATKKDGEII